MSANVFCLRCLMNVAHPHYRRGRGEGRLPSPAVPPQPGQVVVSETDAGARGLLPWLVVATE
jgi:hypothetical protein